MEARLINDLLTCYVHGLSKEKQTSLTRAIYKG